MADLKTTKILQHYLLIPKYAWNSQLFTSWSDYEEIITCLWWLICAIINCRLFVISGQKDDKTTRRENDD